MAGKVAQRKAKLQEDLVTAAQNRIERDGIKQLRARDLAADVGCSVGAIYNVFADIDELILSAGFRTLKSIDTLMTNTMEESKDKPPAERMIALAHSYFEFAREHPNAWAGLFEHRLPRDYELPKWHREGQGILFRHIVAPLSQLLPNENPEDLARLARTLFSAVHGVVVLAREQKVAGVPVEEVKEQLSILIGAAARGLASR